MKQSLRQICIWDDKNQSTDYLYINVDHIVVIEQYSSDPEFNTSVIFPDLTNNSNIPGLTVYLITMSSGRQIQVPITRNSKISIWDELQIPVP